MKQVVTKSRWLKALDGFEIVANDASSDRAALNLESYFRSIGILPGKVKNCRFTLLVDRNGLSLQDHKHIGMHPLHLDLSGMTWKTAGRELLVRSIGTRCNTVVDATAGFGRDTFHLLNVGKTVTAIERSPLVAVMLADVIRRLASPTQFNSFTLVCDDAVRWLSNCSPPDVVYLDPMFPDMQKRSALAAKEVRMLRALVGDDCDSNILFSLAESTALNRVVVKRPVWAGPIRRNPDWEIRGKVVRYDIYMTAS